MKPPRTIRDNPEIICRGRYHFEDDLKRFQKKYQQSGIAGTNKFRELNPSKSSRKRAKQKRATARRIKKLLNK